MRWIAIGTSALVLVGCAVTGGNAPGASRASLAEATAEWVAAYNSRDGARIAGLYDRDAVLWGTVSASLRADPAGVADYFKDAPKRPDARVSISRQEDRVYGDIGVSTGTYTFTDVRDGKNVTNPARFSFVFRKRAGRWLIVDHHSSRLPAP